MVIQIYNPIFLWIKNRSEAQSHAIFDSVRGATKRLVTNANGAESTEATNLDSFDTNGFTVDNELIVNGSSDNMVAWAWKAGGSSASSNSDGRITSSVSANTTSVFSIVTYTGTGANATVGHGLGAVPQVIITKARTPSGRSWGFYHASLGNTKNLYLDGTDSVSTGGTFWNSTTPTSSVFSVGTAGDSNGSTYTLVAYCFAEKQGFSRFGKYTGNNNANGNFIYTGFRPAFVLSKDSASGQEWHLIDNKRDPSNDSDNAQLSPNRNYSEATVKSNRGTMKTDFLSNGFKINTDGSHTNGTGTHIYMAFAESPFVSSGGIPTTAR